MALIKRVRPVGNAAGVIFDRPVLKQAGWDVGTEVRLEVREGRIVLTRHTGAAGSGSESRGSGAAKRGQR